MAQFTYTAVDKKGQRLKGNMEAPNEGEVRVMLRSQSLRPIKISKAGALEVDISKLSFGSGISDTDLLLFTRQLSILITSGIPLVQGLEIISGQITNPVMKQVILSMREKISGGTFLWEAMGQHKKAFPSLYVSMVRAGESSGALDTILKRLIKYLDDGYKLKKLVQGAMIYPIAVVVIGIVVVAVMLTFVIPKFEELLKGSGQELPGPTQFVIDLSHFFQHNILFMIAGVAAAFFLGKKYIDTDEGRKFFDEKILRVPIFGQILLKTAVARFSRTMQTLLSSGINLLDAMDICKDAVGNMTVSEGLSKMRLDIEQGKTMSVAMTKLPVFPGMVVQMITVGETTGNLDKMLERVAEFYENEVQDLVSNMTKLIEPFVLVFLGGAVGGLLIAMYLPIFKMAGGA